MFLSPAATRGYDNDPPATLRHFTAAQSMLQTVLCFRIPEGHVEGRTPDRWARSCSRVCPGRDSPTDVASVLGGRVPPPMGLVALLFISPPMRLTGQERTRRRRALPAGHRQRRMSPCHQITGSKNGIFLSCDTKAPICFARQSCSSIWFSSLV